MLEAKLSSMDTSSQNALPLPLPLPLPHRVTLTVTGDAFLNGHKQSKRPRDTAHSGHSRSTTWSWQLSTVRVLHGYGPRLVDGDFIPEGYSVRNRKRYEDNNLRHV